MHSVRGGVSHPFFRETQFSAVNSRWLQENLQNMDSKVKSMMQLIGEDAVDSFGWKRQELVSLVQEFHGAYCTLAERYDGLAGEVRKNIPGVFKEELTLPETIAIDEDEVPPTRILGGRTAIRKQLRRSPKVDPDEIPHPESHHKDKINKSSSSSSSGDSSCSDSDLHSARSRRINKSKIEIKRESLERLPSRVVYEFEERTKVRSDMDDLQEQLEGLAKSSEEKCRRYEDELLDSNGKLAALKEEKLSLERVKAELELKVLELSAVCSTLEGETTLLREEAKDLRRRMQESEKAKVQEQLSLQQKHQSKCRQLEEEHELKVLELSVICSTLKGETTQLREEAKDLRRKMQDSEREKAQEHLILQQMHQSKCRQLEEEVAYHRDKHRKLSADSSVQMKALEKERASLTTLVAELEAQAKFFSEKCSRLEGEIASTEEAAENFRRSLQESEMKKMELASLEERSKERCGHLEQEVLYLREEREKLITSSRTQLQVLEEEKVSLNRIVEEAIMLQKEEHVKLTAQIQALKEEKAVLNAMVNEMKAQVKSWSGKCSILEEETLVLKGENDELRENLLQNDREHSAQLWSVSQRGEDRCRKLEEEIQYHIEELGKITVNSSAKLQAVIEEKASLSRVNTELDDRIKLFSEECSDLKEEVLKMKHENAELWARFGGVEAEKEKAESEVGTLQQLLSSAEHQLKASCHELQQEISNLTEAGQITASQLDSSHHLVKSLEEEKSSITLERNRLHEEVDYLRVEVADLKKNLEETVKQKQELKLEMDELRQVNIRAQEDISRLKELCDVHEMKSHEVEEKVSMQKMELSELREAIASKVEEVSALQEETRKLHAILENVKEEKTGLSISLDKVSMMLKTTEERCNQLQDQVSSLEEEKLKLLNEKLVIHTHSRGLEEAGFTLQKGKELLESQLASWKQRAEEMQAEIDELKIEEGNIREKLKVSVEKEERARLATQILQQELEAVQANYKMTSEQCHQYAEECSMEKEKVRLSEEEISLQRVKISELQEEGSLKDGKVIALQRSLSKMEELFASSEKKLQEQSLENQKYLAAAMIEKEEHKKLSVQMQALEEEKALLNTMVTEIKAQVKSWSGEYSILEEETLVLKGENEELREKLLQHDREHIQLLSLSQRGEDRCMHLEEEIQYYIDELEKVRVNSSEQLQGVTEENASLSRVNIDLSDRIKLLSEECSNLKEEVLEMKHESEALRGRFQDVQAEKGRAESEVGTLRQLLSSVGHEHEAKCHELRQEISNFKEACHITEAELHNSHHLVKNLEEEKKSLTLETNRLREEVGGLWNSLEEQTEKKQSLELEMDELKQVNIKAQEDILRLKELCDVHERRTREVEEVVSMQEMELSKLGKAISSKVEEISTLQEEIKKLQKMIENVEEERTVLSVELDNMSMMLKTTEEKCNQLHNQVSYLEEEKLQLSNEKLIIHTHSRGLEEAGFTLQKGKDLLESELASLKQKAEELQVEIDELKIVEGSIREKLKISVEKEEGARLVAQSLQEELKVAQANYRNTAEECSTEKEKVRLSEEEISFQRLRISELQEECSLKDGIAIALQVSLSEMEELFGSSEKKLQEQSLEYQKYTAAIMIQKEEHEKVRQALEDEKASLEAMVIETKTQVKSLSGKCFLLEEEILMLKEENEQLRERLLQKDREHAQLMSLKQIDEDRCSKLEEEIRYHIDELEKVRVDSSTQLQVVIEEKASLSRVNMELDDRIKLCSEECSNLKDEVLKMRRESTELEGRFQELEAEKRRVESEVGTLQQLLSSVGHEHKLRCHELQQEISDLKEVSQMTEEKLHSTQNLVKNLEEEKIAMTLERSRLHEEVDNLRVEVGSLWNSLVDQTNQKQALELEMDELKQVNIRAQEHTLRLKELCDVHERKTWEVEEKVSMQKMELSKLGEAISSKVEEVSTLQEETKKLQSMIENVKKENTGLSVELANASMMLRTTEERCKQLQDQNSSLEEEKVQLLNEKSIIHTHSRGLEESRFALKKGKEELESELGLWKQRTEGVQSENNEMRIEILKLTEVSQMTQAQLHSTQQLVKSLEKEKSSLTLERNKLHEEVDNLRVEVGRLQNSLENVKKEKTDISVELDSASMVLKTTEERCNQLQDWVSSLEQEKVQLMNEKLIIHTRLRRVEEAVLILQKGKEALESELAPWKQRAEEMQAEINKLRIEISDLEKISQMTETQLHCTQDLVKKLEEEKSSLTLERSRMHEEVDHLIVELGSLRNSLDEQKEQKKALELDMDELKQVNIIAQEDILRLKESCDLHERKTHEEEEKVSTKQIELSKLGEAIASKVEEVSTLQVETRKLHAMLKNVKKEKTGLSAELENVNMMLKISEERCNQLQDQISSLEEEKVHLSNEKLNILTHSRGLEEASLTLQKGKELLESQMSSWKQKEEEMQAEINESRREILKLAEVSQQLHSTQHLVKYLEEENSSLTLEGSGLSEEVDHLRVEVGSLRNGLDERTKQKQALELEIDELKQVNIRAQEDRLKLKELCDVHERKTHQVEEKVSMQQIELSKLGEAITSKVEEISTLQEQIKKLQSMLENVEKEKTGLSVELDNASMMLKSREERCNQLQDQVSSLEEEKVQLSNEKLTIHTHLRGLEEAGIVLHKAKEALESELASWKQTAEGMQAEINESRIEISKLTEVNQMTETQLHSAQDLVKDLEKEKSSLTLERSRLHEEVDHLRGELGSLQNSLDEQMKLKQALNLEMDELKQVNIMTREDVSRLKELCDMHERKTQEGEKKTSMLQMEVSKLGETIAIKVEEISTLKAEIRKLEAMLENIKTEKTGLSVKLHNVSMMLKSTEERCNQLQDQVSSLEEEKMYLSNEKSIIHAHSRGLQEVSFSLQKGKELLESELASWKQRAEEMQVEIKESRREISNLTEVSQMTAIQLHNTQHLVKSLEEEKSSLTLERIGLCTEVGNLRVEVGSLRNSLEEQTKQKQALELEMDELEQVNIRALESELASWKQRAEGMQAEINELRIEISKLTEVNQMAETQLRSAQDLVKDLEEEKSSSTLERSRLHEEVDHLRVELGSLRNSLNEQTKLKLALNLEMDELKQVNIMTQEDVLSLKELCDMHERKTHEGEKKMLMQQMEVSKLGETIAIKVEEISTLEQEIKKLEAMLENIKTEKTGLSVELHNVSMMLKSTEERCNQLQGQVSSLEEEKVHLSNEKSIIHAQYRGLQEASFSLHKGKELLESELAFWKQRAEEMQVEIKESRREISNLTEVSQMTAMQLHNTQHLVKCLEEEKSSLTLERSGLCTVVDNLRVEVGSLRNSLEEQTKQKQALELEMDELEQVNIRAQEDTLKLKELCDVHESKTHEVEEKMSMQKMELSELGEAITSKVEEISTLQEQIRKLQSMLENVEKEKTGLSVELDNASMMLKSTKLKQVLELEMSELRQQSLIASERLGMLEQEKLLLDEEHRVLHEEISRLRDSLRNLTEKQSSLQSDNQNLRETVSDQSEKIHRLQEQLDSKTQSSLVQEHNLKLKFRALQKALLNVQQEDRDSREISGVVPREATVDVKETLEEELERLQELLMVSNEDSKKLKSEYEDVLERCMALQEDIVKSEKLISSLKQDSSVQADQILTVLAQNHTLQESKAFLEKEAVMKDGHIQKLKEELSQMQEEGEQAREKLQSATGKVSLLEEEIQKFCQALKSAEDETKDHKLRESVLEEKIEMLQKIYSSLETEHGALKHESKRGLDESVFLEKRLREVQDELSLQKVESARLKVEILDALEKIEALTAENKRLQQEKEACTIEIVSGAKRIEGLQEEMSNLHGEIAKKLQEEEEMIRSMQTLSKQYEEDKKEFERGVQAYVELDAMHMIATEKLRSLEEQNTLLAEQVVLGKIRIKGLETEAEQLLTEKATIDSKLASRSDHASKLEEQLSTMQPLLAHLNREVDERNIQIQKLQEALKKANQSILDARQKEAQDMSDLQGKLESVVNELNKGLEDENVEIKQQLLGMEEEKRKLFNTASLRSACLKETERMVLTMKEEPVVAKSESFKMGESHKVEEDIHSSLQAMFAKLESNASNMQSSIKNLEDKNGELWQKISDMHDENGRLLQEISAKTSQIKKLEQMMATMKEERVMIEAEVGFRIHQVNQAQEEVSRLKQEQKVTNSDYEATMKRLQSAENEVCMLQTQNQHLGLEVAELMKAEKHFSVALRFTRAEASHLVQKTKMLREEIDKKDMQIKGLEATLYDKDQLACQKLEEEKANLKAELVKVNQEVALLKEESKRQIAIIHDRSEEKREAIRQLCFSIDLLQEKNRNLGRVFDDVREKLKVRGTHGTDR